jgi:shikimate kinase
LPHLTGFKNRFLNLDQHIFLTGFMGSGKTTIGKKLANHLKREFIDLDRYIEKKENMSIPLIFEQKGENKFREIESNSLEEVLKLKGPRVIALGGGTVCFHSNLEHIKKSGILLYIELPAAVLADRITNSKTIRPILKNLQGIELINSVENLLNTRKKFYEQSHITVNGLNLTPQLLHQKILGFTKENIF